MAVPRGVGGTWKPTLQAGSLHADKEKHRLPSNRKVSYIQILEAEARV